MSNQNSKTRTFVYDHPHFIFSHGHMTIPDRDKFFGAVYIHTQAVLVFWPIQTCDYAARKMESAKKRTSPFVVWVPFALYGNKTAAHTRGRA